MVVLTIRTESVNLSPQNKRLKTNKLDVDKSYEHDNTINNYADIHFVYQYALQRLTNQ